MCAAQGRIRRGRQRRRRPCAHARDLRGERGRASRRAGTPIPWRSSRWAAPDLVDAHGVRRPVVEFRRLRRRVSRNLLRMLEGSSVRQVRRDSGRPERVAARRGGQPRRSCPPLDHRQDEDTPGRSQPRAANPPPVTKTSLPPPGVRNQHRARAYHGRVRFHAGPRRRLDRRAGRRGCAEPAASRRSCTFRPESRPRPPRSRHTAATGPDRPPRAGGAWSSHRRCRSSTRSWSSGSLEFRPGGLRDDQPGETPRRQRLNGRPTRPHHLAQRYRATAPRSAVGPAE